MVTEDKIKYYLPLQELDELTSTQSNLVDLSADDLFLISKLSAAATDTQHSIAVSKKLRYGNFSSRLSGDFGLGQIKTNVATLSKKVNTLSSSLASTSALLCTAINTTSSYLSAKIKEANTKITQISGIIDEDFRYGPVTCSLISSTSSSGTAKALLAEQVTLQNGKLTKIAKWTAIDDLIQISGTAVAAGIIDGEYFVSSHIVLSQQDTLRYTTQYPCYLNISLSVVESDSSDSPLLVQMLSDDNFITLAQFNNSGGLRGESYYSYYNTSIPLQKNKTIVIRYNAAQLAIGSMMDVTEYKFYAVPSASELSNFVQKPSVPISQNYPLDLYKVQINQDGLVLNAQRVNLDTATISSQGLVRLRTNTIHAYSTDNMYGLSVDTINRGYVTVPPATSSHYGTVMLGNVDIDGSYGLLCNPANGAYIKVPAATTSALGTIKVSSPTLDTGLEYPVYLKNTAAYVKVPFATTDTAGLIKVGQKPTSGTATPVYINDTGTACVNVATQINFTTTALTSLTDSDKLLVNYKSNNLSNAITYGNFKKLIAPNSLIGPEQYDMVIVIYLNNADAVQSHGTIYYPGDDAAHAMSQHGTYCWDVASRINRPFICSYAYVHRVKNVDSYGITVVCDGICVGSHHPHYMKSSTSGQSVAYQYVGYMKGNNQPFCVVSSNKSFQQSTVVDYVKIFIKYV